MGTRRPLLAGRFQLAEVIGEGGMAVVWRAWDHVIDREVAVKVLREQYASDPDFVRRFRREARNAGRLAHPNIVSVYDTGVDGPVQYIVMQLVDGPDLTAVLAERGRLPVANALGITGEVAKALEAAHARGIVHRDIKPSNILLASDGAILVADFGIAVALGDTGLTVPGLLLGSAAYSSPEQVLGQTAGAPSDIFSLGVVLYELLTGRPPWDGTSPAGVALARLRVPADPPSHIVPDLPAGIDPLVMRALAREPSDRYQTAKEMSEAIRGWWRTEGRAGVSLDPRMAAAQRRRSTRPGRAATTMTAARAPANGSTAITEPAAAAAAPTVVRYLRPAPVAAPSTAGTTTTSPTEPRTAPTTASSLAPEGRPGEADPRRRRRAVPPWLLPLAAVMVIAVAILGIGSRLGPFGGGVLSETASPRATLAAAAPESPGGASAVPATPAATSRPAPTPSPTASSTPGPTPSPRPTPTMEPTPPPTPPPTLPPTPPATPPPTPPPTARPTQAPAPQPPPATVAAPTETVARFYFLVEEGRFDEAAQLWTAEMRRRYPPDGYIDGRFAPTERIDVNRNEVIAFNRGAGTATVAVDLVEVRTDGDVRRWIGDWDLVRTDAGWLMDDPDF